MVGSVSGTVPYLDDQVVRYDTRCYFNVRSKADISQLNLPHDWKYLLSEQVLPGRMASCRDSVLAADAKKRVVQAK